MSPPRTVRILKCVCVAQEWQGKQTSGPGMHTGQVGPVVGFAAEGHTLVYFKPGSVACSASEVQELEMEEQRV